MPDSRPSVSVTGIGIVSTIGDSPDEFIGNLRRNKHYVATLIDAETVAAE